LNLLYLNALNRWKNYNTKLFNAGAVRRDLYDPEESGASGFYDPTNVAGLSSRANAAEQCMTAMISFLTQQGGEVAIFDATNSVNSRRRRIIERCNGVATVVFVEVLCDDAEILEENIMVKVSEERVCGWVIV
jgi:predicted kinase